MRATQPRLVLLTNHRAAACGIRLHSSWTTAASSCGLICEAVFRRVSRACPTNNVQLKPGGGTDVGQVWEPRWPRGEPWFLETAHGLWQQLCDGQLHCRLPKDDCIAMTTSIRDSNRFTWTLPFCSLPTAPQTAIHLQSLLNASWLL